jgi:hypothetical protein
LIDKEQLMEHSQVINRKDLALDKVKNAKDLTEILYDACIAQITAIGSLPFPTAFILDEKSCLLLDVSNFMRSEASKDVLSSLLRSLASNPNVLAIALAYEAYMLVASREESKTITSLETHPNRIESLVVHGEWKYADSYLIFGRILRGKDGKIVDIFHMRDAPQGLYGRFSNLFIPLPKPGEFKN